MVTEVKEKLAMDLRDVNFKFDGQWVILRTDPADGLEYVVAYGNGSHEDRDALHQIVRERYRGKALLTYGHTPREDVVCGIYDC